MILPGEADDALEMAGIADVGVILDTSIYAEDDDLYQQEFAAALALELDMWATGYDSR